MAEAQHDVVRLDQLLDLGMSYEAIRHRVRSGKLFPRYTSVYAVGRPRLTQEGEWLAAVFACGAGAALSHDSGAELMRVVPRAERPIEVSVAGARRPSGVVVHRRRDFAEDCGTCDDIPVTSPALTLIDIAPRLTIAELERAVSEADSRDLIDPETLGATLARHANRPGVAKLRGVLDSATFVLTETELERLFVPIAASVGLPKPETQEWVNGFRVDFFWPELGIVVETDSLRFHRTAQTQTRDLRKDQIHYAAGLEPLRFSHRQVKYEQAHVEATLAAAVRRARK